MIATRPSPALVGGAGDRAAHACSCPRSSCSNKRWAAHWATFWSYYLWAFSTRMDYQASQHTVNANWSTELNVGMGRLRSDHNGWHSHVEKRWLHIVDYYHSYPWHFNRVLLFLILMWLGSSLWCGYPLAAGRLRYLERAQLLRVFQLATPCSR